MGRLILRIIVLILAVNFFSMLSAEPAPADSIKYLVERLETVLKNELDKNREIGRYQLQSINIDRTHWHYLLDTATGELYRMELSRTPANSKWVLISGPNFDKSILMNANETDD